MLTSSARSSYSSNFSLFSISNFLTTRGRSKFNFSILIFFADSVPRRQRFQRARIHHRHAIVQELVRYRSCRHRQTLTGLCFSAMYASAYRLLCRCMCVLVWMCVGVCLCACVCVWLGVWVVVIQVYLEANLLRLTSCRTE